MIELIIALAFAILIAVVITGSMISSMNTAVKQRAASNYVRPGSFNLTQQSDIFIREETTRTEINDHDDNNDFDNDDDD